MKANQQAQARTTEVVRRTYPHGIGLGLIWLLGAALQETPAQFVAFNEQVSGANTSNSVTAYDLRPTAGVTNAGPLRNITNGVNTTVILTITNHPSLSFGSASGLPNAGSPASNVFGAYVTFGNGYLSLGTNQLLAHVLSGLDPNSLYSLKATTIKGNAATAYLDRWTLFELVGAASFTNAHSPGCVTNGLGGIVLASNQVALCAGDNREGRMVDWEGVRPRADGTLVIHTKRFYQVQRVSGVITNNFISPSYGLEVLRVEEFPPSGGCSPARFSSGPASVTAWLRDPVSLAALGAGTAPLGYQWYQSATPTGPSNLIAGATGATYSLAAASLSDIGYYTVVVKNACGTNASEPVSLTLRTNPPAIVTPATNLTVPAGGPCQFVVEVSGSTPLVCQWYKDGVAIPGATTPSYYRPAVDCSDAGLYTLMVTNRLGAATNEVWLNVPQLPVEILQQPQDLVVLGGDPAVFTVLATGGNLRYQWYKGSGTAEAIPDATNATYTIPNTVTTQAGCYWVVVSNSSGPIPSRCALLAVHADPPVITTQPSDTWTVVDRPVSLPVLVTGTPPLVCQWSKDGVVLPGATNPTYSLVRADETSVGLYRLEVSNRFGRVFSRSALLSITYLPVVLTNQPQDQTAAVGGRAAFGVGASGSRLAYQWFVGETPLVNETNATLLLSDLLPEHGGAYRVRVSNPVGTNFSRWAALSVVDLPRQPFVAFNDHAQGPASGRNVTFYSLDAGANSGPLKNWLSGSNLPITLTITNLNGISSGGGTVLEGGPAFEVFKGAVDFSGANVALPNSNAAVGHVLTGLDGRGRYSLKGTANRGSASYTNRWTLFELLGARSFRSAHSAGCLTNDPARGVTLASNQVALCAGTNTVPGALFDWEEVVPGPAGQVVIVSRKYTGPVPSGANDLASSAYGLAGLRVENVVALSITEQPQGEVIAPGYACTFSVGLSGSSPIACQWLKDGVPIPEATNSTYTLPAVGTNDSGTYALVASNGIGAVLSSNATLRVGLYPAELISQPDDRTTPQGTPFQFSIGVTGAAPFSYQWYCDAGVIPDATNATYGRAAASPADVGAYWVVVSNVVNALTSRVATLTLPHAPVTLLSQPTDLTVWQGADAALSVAVSGSDPRYQWFKSGVAIPGATNATCWLSNLLPTDSGWYAVMVSNDLNRVVSHAAALGVQLLPVGLVPPDQVWRYDDSSADLGTNWFNPAYDDTRWSNGPAVLGFPLSEPLPPPYTVSTVLRKSVQGVQTLTYYFRTPVFVPRVLVGMTLTASNLIDDGAVFYLNGLEVGRIGMTNGPINALTPASRTVGYPSDQGWESLTVAGEPLVPGTNLLAVEVHQAYATSSDVILESVWQLNYPAPAPLEIIWPPLSQWVPEGRPASLRVDLTGAPETFQWFKTSGQAVSAVPGATNALLRFANPRRGFEDGDYYVVASNAFGVTTSTVATLTLPEAAPIFHLEPASQTACLGESVSWQVAAGGTEPLSFQWLHNGVAIPKATNADYRISGVTTNEAGLYTVAVSNALGVIVSAEATLAVFSEPPALTLQPTNVDVLPGETVRFRVAAEGCPPLCYQWQCNGVDLPGATDPVLTLISVQDAQVGSYRAVVRNPIGTTLSEPAFLTLPSFGAALDCPNLGWSLSGVPWSVQTSVTHQGPSALQTGATSPSETSLLTTTVTGPGQISFWWRLQTGDTRPILRFTIDTSIQVTRSEILDWERWAFYVVPGEHVLRWTFAVNDSTNRPVGWLDQVTFRTNELGSVITRAPLDQTVPAGTNVLLQVVADGYPFFGYQWFHNGQGLPRELQPRLLLRNVQAEEAGRYTIVVSNEFGLATATAALTVTASAPAFRPQPARLPVLAGRSVAVPATASGSEPISYQWRFEDRPLPGQTERVLRLPQFSTNQAGHYSVLASNAFGVALSPDLELLPSQVARVIHLSVDGLAAQYLADEFTLAPELYPAFMRLQREGSFTLNARCDPTDSITVPNHLSMLTGRPVRQPAGQPNTVAHGYTDDSSTAGYTLHLTGNPNVPYKASVFDVAHDHGLRTAFLAGKTSLRVCAESYNATNGAPDSLPPDDGRNKIDVLLVTNAYGTPIVDTFLPNLTNATPCQYAFLHLVDPDLAGHYQGWGSAGWLQAVQTVDTQLGRVLAALQNHPDPTLALETVLLLTADHGGQGGSHSQADLESDYTIPIFAWGPGFMPGTDLYSLFANRADPETNWLDYNAPWQPLRNGDTGNLALSLLGLPSIPGSSLIPVFVTHPPALAISASGQMLRVGWSAAAAGFRLEAADQLGSDARWEPVSTGLVTNANSVSYGVATPTGNRFFRLRK